MPRALNTLVGRLALLLLVIHAVLPPLLFYRLDAVARTNAILSFTRYTRAYARSLASELELEDVLDSLSRTVVFLDGSVQGGNCVYAALDFNGRLLGSTLAETPAWIQQRGDDAAFGTSKDNIYAASIPIHRAGASGTLYLGFDEGPTIRQARDARHQIIAALVAYAIASVAVAVIFVRLVSRPLTQLQEASRRVARGDSAARLGTSSSMVEIVDLARDLESMRAALAGTAGRLRQEMQQREVEQAERAGLESQLRHEQRLATVGTFAGGLAHEFNNILVPLVLYTEEALDEIGSGHPARAYLERVMGAAARASDVVAKMLAFSRPIGERRPVLVDFGATVNEALDLFQALIPVNIELGREIEAHNERVLGDPTLMNQVVLNLCSNAVHAMRDQGGRLTVSLMSTDRVLPEAPQGSPNRVVELHVKDTGHGMSRPTQERIFEPFFTTRDVGQGTGLGLSVVHGIVASMGGTITVSSEVGAGTEFVVILPTVTRGV
jgi:signal transduction histidine kinase